MSTPLRLGTRGSRLALRQANEVAQLLTICGYAPRVVAIETTGDRRRDVPLAAIGGKGLFVKELEVALLRGEIDLAVHSLKDVPTIIPDDFVLAGFLERVDPRDVWVHRDGTPITEVPNGTVIGTSAPRRRVQLQALYPHLAVEEIRGNVDTRIEKAKGGRYGGVVLASAGITRLGRASEITSFFDVDEMVPAAGQGIVVLEALASNEVARAAAQRVSDDRSALAAHCERGILRRFGHRLDCYSPVGVNAAISEDQITARVFLSSSDGTQVIRTRHSETDADAVITAAYDELVRLGAEEIL